ncbi:MAG: RpiB/LacA/LacB family sugar-phosphate isomerase [Acidobacteria bacterium]|nr:RpiB/LacA/LacB family sugar-phosphate isomerase [Acidobacteriota bacterium]
MPVADVRRVVVGSDHTGVALKQFLVSALRGRGLAVQAVGPEGASPAPVDYPDIAEQVGLVVVRGEADAGIVIDGAGLGSTMAANKVRGVRAALCFNETLARYARQHNGANVLALGATLVSTSDALAIAVTFFTTSMTEPRYIRRVLKLKRLDG